MPGITGIIAKRNMTNIKEKTGLMTECMLHEPFYHHGVFECKELNMCVGFVTIENSFSDCMPIVNHNKKKILFLTGECYFDDEVINKFSKNADNKIPDASLLMQLYEEQGEGFFGDLNGWYNGFLIDLDKREATLFNDRYGIRRIYYYENNDAFYFSSEAKSLLKILPELKSLNSQSVGEYLVYDCILENRTYFNDIFLLPSGSKWTFTKGTLRKEKYFDPSEYENQTKLSKEQFYNEFKDTFDKILPRYFREEKIAMSLTGGLDTRQILSFLNPEPNSVPCFTFGGLFKDIFDVRIAPKIAKLCNQEFYHLKMDDNDYLAHYDFHVRRSIHITDGVESVDKADVINFNKMARGIAPIRMTGKYGSQVIKDVLAFRDRSPYSEIINNDFISYLDKAKKTCSGVKKGHDYSFLLYNEIPWWWNGFIASESSQVTVRSPYLDNDLVKLLYRIPEKSNSYGLELQSSLIKEKNNKLYSVHSTNSKIIKFLMNIDRMHIRERLPYSLTHVVGRVDSVLKPLHLDKIFFGLADFRRYRSWYRDQLSSYIKDILLNQKTLTRPYWNGKNLQKIVLAHINGKGTYLREIRKALQIELIHRILIENN